MTRFEFLLPPRVRGQIPKMYRWNPPHVGLAYLAAALEQEGVSVRVVDLERVPLKRYLARFRRRPPDLVGVSAFTKNVASIAYLSRVLKRVRPDVRIVAGGPHATAVPERTLRELPWLDVVVVGEGEVTLVELVRQLSSGGDDGFDSIDGIAYRTAEGGVRVTKPRRPVEDLDSLPFPAWHLFGVKSSLPYGDLCKRDKLELPVLTSRGCPYSCVFCQKVLGSRVRKRSVKNVVEELERNVERFGMTHAMFVDETWGVDRERSRALCRAIIAAGLHDKISWGCYDRVSNVDEPTLRLMRAAGCKFMLFGIETCSDETLSLIKKGNTTAQQRRAVELTAKYGVKSYLSVIFGFPKTNERTANDDLTRVLKLGGTFYQFGKLVPFPGTEIYEWAESGKFGLSLATRDWREYDTQFGGALDSTTFPRERLRRFHALAYLKMLVRLFPKSVATFLYHVNWKNFLSWGLVQLLRKSNRAGAKAGRRAGAGMKKGSPAEPGAKPGAEAGREAGPVT
ncbi:MAG: radical SAM protein [Promethearchaeota archaeon]